MSRTYVVTTHSPISPLCVLAASFFFFFHLHGRFGFWFFWGLFVLVFWGFVLFCLFFNWECTFSLGKYWKLNFVSRCLHYAFWSPLVTSAIMSRSQNSKLKGASETRSGFGRQKAEFLCEGKFQPQLS